MGLGFNLILGELLVTDCKSISSSFSHFEVLNTKREDNCLAHRLAKFALHNPDSVWIELYC